jgi:tetratricopeptide (TPR) repeat protein
VLYPSLAFRARALLEAGRQQEADTEANELLAMLAHQGVLPTRPLGRDAELVELLADVKTPTGWFEAAAAVAAGEFQRAADHYDQIQAQPDAAFARLQGAKHLVAAGRRAETNAQLRRAVAFYHRVSATGYLQESQTLLAATA